MSPNNDLFATKINAAHLLIHGCNYILSQEVERCEKRMRVEKWKGSKSGEGRRVERGGIREYEERGRT